MSRTSPATKIMMALLVSATIAVASLALPGFLSLPVDGPLPPSAVTHSVMVVISFLLILYLSKGKLSDYGFTVCRMKPTIVLWIIPTSVLSLMQFMASRSGSPPPEMVDLSKVQVVLFVWIYASICEETFVRGLLQGYLSTRGQQRVFQIGKWPISAPVLLGACFFGTMHVGLWPKMGPFALVPMSLAMLLGIVTGYYREKSGSLLPAILIHALFNIGGSLPQWILASVAE